ncbi:hypothetical protein [Bacillus sp. SD088]|uniref:hypothetical protein n=1 Tax=Bacillus sp. SD088 TaxID=2782012 RepID=UPI001A9741E8|nr:hypothetical protein [Bacillus sp. SD088]MBO0991463.1 hypothetical protein [Bacillus sp. SD088]
MHEEAHSLGKKPILFLEMPILQTRNPFLKEVDHRERTYPFLRRETHSSLEEAHLP